MDPSDRFTELLPCGCSYEQGQWFYCPLHQGGDLHSQHTTFVPECDRCQDALQEAREIEQEAPWWSA